MGDSQEGRNLGVYPLVRPRGVSADSARFASAPLPMSTIIKIDKYPQKGYTNLTRGYGGIGRRARFRFWCPRRAGSSPVTRTSKKTLWNLSTAFFFCLFLLGQLALCLLLKALLGYDGALVRALTDQTRLIVCGNLEGKHLAVRRDLGQLGLDADFHALRRSGNVAYVYQRADRGLALFQLTGYTAVYYTPLTLPTNREV